MIRRLLSILAVCSMALGISPAWADEYQDTINVFKKATESTNFVSTAYGYAVFPTIGKGGLMYQATLGGQKFSYTKR